MQDQSNQVPPIGAVFDTPFEQGCVVVGELDAAGNFDALDSDGVLCSFSPALVQRVHGAAPQDAA